MGDESLLCFLFQIFKKRWASSPFPRREHMYFEVYIYLLYSLGRLKVARFIQLPGHGHRAQQRFAGLHAVPRLQL